MDDLVPILAEYLAKNFSIAVTSKKFKINGVLTSSILSYLPVKAKWEELGFGRMAVLEFSEMATLEDKLLRHFKQILRPKSQVAVKTFDTKINFEALIPFMNPETGERLLYDPKAEQLSKFKFEAWEKSVSRETMKVLLENSREAILRYNPYTLKRRWEEDLGEVGSVTVINTCAHPRWRYISVQPELSPLFQRFLHHLFPGPLCWQYVINWLHTAIYERCGTYLVLNGKKGIGKGIFCTAISKLVGENNYIEGQRSFLDKEFNLALKNTRIMVLDEIAINTATHINKLKSYLNTFQTLEGKGVEAQKEELHCSMIISNNSISDMHVEQDDRRFSVLDITEATLYEAFTKRECQELFTYINSEDFPGAFGYFIDSNVQEDFNHMIPYRGELYNRLVISSLFAWKAEIYNILLGKTKTHYTLESLEAQIKTLPKHRVKIEDFLKNFLHNGVSIATLGTCQGKPAVIPCPELTPEITPVEI